MPTQGDVPKRRKVWEDDDDIELLAWADKCAEHSFDFQKTIVGQLLDQKRKTFTWDQVKGKLERIWLRYGRHGGNAKEIYTMGTAFALPNLSEDDKSQIRNVLRQIKPPNCNGAIQSHILSPTQPVANSVETSKESDYGRRSSSSDLPPLLAKSPTPPIQYVDQELDWHRAGNMPLVRVSIYLPSLVAMAGKTH